jgi:hypothetical protein
MAGADPARILAAAARTPPGIENRLVNCDGDATRRVVDVLLREAV